MANSRHVKSRSRMESTVCKYHQLNACKRGNSCFYSHEIQLNRPRNRNTEPVDSSRNVQPSTSSDSKSASKPNGRNASGRPLPDQVASAASSNDVPEVSSVLGACKFFAVGKCAKGDACDSRHLTVNSAPLEETPGKYLLFEESSVDRVSKTWISIASANPSFEVCKYFGEGSCSKGDACTFLHICVGSEPVTDSSGQGSSSKPASRNSDRKGSSPASRTVCKHFARKGFCAKGSSCMFRHETQTALPRFNDLNSWGNIQEQNQNEDGWGNNDEWPERGETWRPEDDLPQDDGKWSEEAEKGTVVDQDLPGNNGGWARDGGNWVDETEEDQPGEGENESLGEAEGELEVDEVAHRSSHEEQSLDEKAEHPPDEAVLAVNGRGSGCLEIDETPAKLRRSQSAQDFMRISHFDTGSNVKRPSSAPPATALSCRCVACQGELRGRRDRCTFLHQNSSSKSSPSDSLPEASHNIYHTVRLENLSLESGPFSPPPEFSIQCTCKEHDCEFFHSNRESPEESESTPEIHVQGYDVANGDSADPNHAGFTDESNHQDAASSEAENGSCKFFTTKGGCKRGSKCFYRHDADSLSPDTRLQSTSSPTGNAHWTDTLNDTISSNNTVLLPTKSNNAFTMPCRFFADGNCLKGNQCTYRHESEPGALSSSPDPIWGQPPVDQDWTSHDRVEDDLQTGERGWGDAEFTPAHADAASMPCKYFALGSCKKGESCTYLHAKVQIPSGSTRNCSAEKDPWSTSAEQGEEASGCVTAPGGGPSSFRKMLCQFFSQGNCRNGNACKFEHFPVEQKSGEEAGDASNIPATQSLNWSGQDWSYDGWGTLNEPSPWDDPAPAQLEPFDEVRSLTAPCSYFAAGTCRKGDSCRYRHDPVGANQQAAAVYSDVKPGDAESSRNREETYQGANHTDRNASYENAQGSSNWVNRQDDRPAQFPPICKYFQQGICNNGDSCRFRHDDTSGAELCPYFSQGVCRKGNNCRYSHVLPESLQAPASLLLKNGGESSTRGQIDSEPSAQEFSRPSTPITESTVFYCTVQFGPGAVVKDIRTPFETRWILVSQVPPEITETGLRDLAGSSGDLLSAIINDFPSPRCAHLEYASYPQASRAIQILDNHEVACGNAKLDFRHGLFEQEASLESRTVKIGWNHPSRQAWATYSSITVAKAQAQRLNGIIFDSSDGRKLKASFESPKKNQTHSFMVRLECLPLDMDAEVLTKFCEASSVHTAEALYDRESSLQQIRNALVPFQDSLDSFDVLSAKETKLKATAFAQFSTVATAALVIRDLENLRERNPTLKAMSPRFDLAYSIRYGLPARLFGTLKERLDDLRNAHEQQCKIRYEIEDEMEHPGHQVFIRAYATDPKLLGHAKVELEKVLNGRILTSRDNDAWDDFFDSTEGEDQLRKINSGSQFFVRCDRRLRNIRVFGSTDADLDRVTTSMHKLLQKIDDRRHIFFLRPPIWRKLLPDGLHQLTNKLKKGKITLNFASQSLVVIGDKGDVAKIEEDLNEWDTSKVPSTVGAVACAICYGAARKPVKLFCGHLYCRPCIEHWLRSAAGPPFSAPVCIATSDSGGSCAAALPMNVIRNFLSPVGSRDLLEASFLAHVHTRTENWRFCPTWDCQVVYRPSESGTVLKCPSCQSRICPACHIEFHEGLTCKEYQEVFNGDGIKA